MLGPPNRPKNYKWTYRGEAPIAMYILEKVAFFKSQTKISGRGQARIQCQWRA